MPTKAFNTITFIAMLLTIVTAIAGLVGIPFTGFFPAIAVLLLLTCIPVASRFYSKKIAAKSIGFQKRYYSTLTAINLLCIVVIFWMAFVIIHDRILKDCC